MKRPNKMASTMLRLLRLRPMTFTDVMWFLWSFPTLQRMQFNRMFKRMVKRGTIFRKTVYDRVPLEVFVWRRDKMTCLTTGHDWEPWTPDSEGQERRRCKSCSLWGYQ